MSGTRWRVQDLPRNALVCLYGAGEFGEAVLKEMQRERPDLRVECFLDGRKQGRFHGVAIRTADDPAVPREALVLICSSHHAEIERTLEQNGFQHRRCMDQARYLPRKYLSQVDLDILQAVRPYTMTSVERLQSLLGALEYVVRHDVPGSIVECGVWAGGSIMAAALKLKALGDTRREIWLYDTFEGMTTPTAADVDNTGRDAPTAYARTPDRGEGKDWCYSDLETVRRNVFSTGYPEERFRFVKGDVLRTLPGIPPERIALLRLDTDWYESTAREMEHLYPRLTRHGVLILDDYNFWMGSRKAVDEYFAEHAIQMFLQRVDDSAVMGVKLEE